MLLFLTSIIDFPEGLSVSNTSLKNCSGYWKNMYKNLNFAISNYFQSFWQAKLWISQITLPFFVKVFVEKGLWWKVVWKGCNNTRFVSFKHEKSWKNFLHQVLVWERNYIHTDRNFLSSTEFLFVTASLEKNYASIYLNCLSALDIKVKMSFPAYLWKCFCDLCP